MRRGLLLALVVSTIPISTASAQEARRTEAPRATVQVVSNGVFSLTEGSSIYIEEKNNRVLVAFPKRSERPRKGAYWPGPKDGREKCETLGAEEFELVIENQNICVRMGIGIDVLRHLGEWHPDSIITGGCWIDVVRIERAEPPAEIILRVDCDELRNLLSTKK